jgi:hypothetical protein
MTPACHRIGALQIELRLGEEAEARPLMDRVSALREPRLEGLLQRVFEELSPPGRCDRLDALQLDLGVLPLAGFDDAFLARLEPALRQALALQLRGRPAEPPVKSVVELLRVFARTGSLPWWADRADRTLIGAQIRRVLELAPEAWWALIGELQASPTALERLAAACDESTLAVLLAAILPSRNGLAAGVAGAEAPPAAELDGVLSAGLSLAARVRLLRLGMGQSAGPASAAVDPLLPSSQTPAHGSDPEVWLRRLEAKDLSSARVEQPPGAAPLAPGPRPVVPPRSAPDPADPDELSLEDGGLVILWPFFETLLSRLEFIDHRRRVFPHEEARNQAIALLSFLVEGDPDPPEWRLALAKVLCGLSPLAPWRLEEPLQPEALVEGERLLEAVIAHGGLAEEMAPEDLRGLILRRPAVLTSRTGAWLLRVERRPEDALLERFPWGWSWIRLPWMDHPLQVEW